MEEPVRVSTEGERRPLSWLQLFVEANRTMRSSFGSALPEEFWRQMRMSKKSALLAVRSVIDSQIDRMELEEAATKDRVVTHIPVS